MEPFVACRVRIIDMIETVCYRDDQAEGLEPSILRHAIQGVK